MKKYFTKLILFSIFFVFIGSSLKAENVNHENNLQRARVAFSNQEYTSAITIWSKIISSKASIDIINEALMNRAKVYVMISQPNLALIDINNIKDSSSQYEFDKSLLRGVVYIQLKQYKLALTELDKAQILDPSQHLVYSNRHVAYKGLGKLEKAKKDLEMALSMDPSLSNHYNLAVLERLFGNSKNCINLLTSILQSSPEHLPSIEQRGLCYADANLHELAIVDMLKVIEIDAYNINALRQLGYSLLSQGDKQNGVKYFEAASEILLSQGKINEYKKLLDVISNSK